MRGGIGIEVVNSRLSHPCPPPPPPPHPSTAGSAATMALTTMRGTRALSTTLTKAVGTGREAPVRDLERSTMENWAPLNGGRGVGVSE